MPGVSRNQDLHCPSAPCVLAYATCDSALEGPTTAASYLSRVTMRGCAQRDETWQAAQHHPSRGADRFDWAHSKLVQSLDDCLWLRLATMRTRSPTSNCRGPAFSVCRVEGSEVVCAGRCCDRRKGDRELGRRAL